MEDSFRSADLTHIVMVAADSDYIPLAQHCKRIGRYIIGIGVSGATSTSLAAACHEFADYDSLPGVVSAAQLTAHVVESADAPAAASAVSDFVLPACGEPDGAEASAPANPAVSPAARKAATALLVRAMDLLANNDEEWQHASALKRQVRRMDPSFQERTLGFRQFSEFLKSRHAVVELERKSPTGPVLLCLRSNRRTPPPGALDRHCVFVAAGMPFAVASSSDSASMAAILIGSALRARGARSPPPAWCSAATRTHASVSARRWTSAKIEAGDSEEAVGNAGNRLHLIEGYLPEVSIFSRLGTSIPPSA
ncbi:OST-HTH/LOTUS domain-containing protein [Cryobacterium zongtaii]|uniref:NYN domain-containing protein n=1 Tax=Cryobacterium zongtaii TaxID=1259217 RepID=UPI00269CEA86